MSGLQTGKWKGTHHVVVGLLLLLLLLLLLGRLSLSSSTTRGGRSRRCGAGTTSTDVREQVLDVLALERLREERCPDGLDFDVRRVGQRGDFVGLKDAESDAIALRGRARKDSR